MKNKILLALKIILSGILLTYLLSIIPLNEIIDSIFSTNLFLFLAGMLLAMPINYLSALETQYLTRIQGINLSVFEILKIHLVTNFYGLFLPGTLSGGAVKWYKFSKHGNKSTAAAVVVFNRFLEILMIILIGIIFSFPAFYSLGNQNLFVVLALILFFMIMLYFLFLNKSGLNFITKIFLILPLPGFIKEIIGKLAYAMHQFRNLSLREHFEIIGLLFLYHVIGVLSFFCFAKSLNINLSIWILGWVRSAMALAIMLPFSFAGLGIREGTLVFLLGQYGVMQSDSMALSFLFLFRSILTSLTGGLFELKDFAFSKKKKENNKIEIIEKN